MNDRTIHRHGSHPGSHSRAGATIITSTLVALAFLFTPSEAFSQCTSCQDVPATSSVTVNSQDWFPGTNCDITVNYKQYLSCPGGTCEIEIVSIEYEVSQACSALNDGQLLEIALGAAFGRTPCTPTPPATSTQVTVYMGACMAAYQFQAGGKTYRGIGKCGDLCCSATYLLNWETGIADKIADHPAPGAECPPIDPYEVAFTGECKSACDNFPDRVRFR